MTALDVVIRAPGGRIAALCATSSADQGKWHFQDSRAGHPVAENHEHTGTVATATPHPGEPPPSGGPAAVRRTTLTVLGRAIPGGTEGFQAVWDTAQR
ncbi:hypothetical protein [Streptomyces sp. NPDC002187]|uniref:hypothetical protein n=1 Tax=Streptomyces sp. NPDC002187 TaxID=3364637 RepID=UPI0036A2300A